MITSEEFLQLMKQPDKQIFRIGNIPSSYTSGRPQVIFDGESSPSTSTKEYPYLSSYSPKAGDRVLLIIIAGSYVILGKII